MFSFEEFDIYQFYVSATSSLVSVCENSLGPFWQYLLSIYYQQIYPCLTFSSECTLSLSISFSELQLKLLYILLTILCINVIVIHIFWKMHAFKIRRHIKRQGTKAMIEELRKSINRLKLPKYYSPRY